MPFVEEFSIDQNGNIYLAEPLSVDPSISQGYQHFLIVVAEDASGAEIEARMLIDVYDLTGIGTSGSNNENIDCPCTCTCEPVASVDLSDANIDVSQSASALQAVVDTTPSNASTGNPHPVLEFDLTLQGGAKPNDITAVLTYGTNLPSQQQLTKTVSLGLPSSLSTTSESVQGKFALQVDATALPTARYDYTVDITLTFPDSSTSTLQITGYDHLVNHIDSPFGNRWSVPDLDWLEIGTGGVSHFRGEGTAGYFVTDGSGGFITPDGTNAELFYDSNADEYSVVNNQRGGTLIFDGDGLLIERQNQSGVTVRTYSYIDADSDGNTDDIASITDTTTGRQATYTYNTAGTHVTEYTDFEGRATAYTYNTNGTLQKFSRLASGTSGQIDVAYEYDPTTLQVTKITDEEGGETQIAYDTATRLATSQTKPGQGTETYVSQAAALIDTFVPVSGLFATRTNSEGTWRIRYDRFGYELEKVNPSGSSTEWVRDASGRVLRERHRDDQGTIVMSTWFTYDKWGRQTSVRHNDGLFEFWTYPSGSQQRQPLTYTDRGGNVTTYTYVADGLYGEEKLESVTLPDPDGDGPLEAPVWNFEYTVIGQLKKEIGPDPDGVGVGLPRPVTEYTYHTIGNGKGQVATVTLPDPDPGDLVAAPVYSFAYNSAGQVITETDPNGNVTTTAYDDYGRVESITYPDPDDTGPLFAAVISYSYDSAGRRVTETDARGLTKTYQDSDSDGVLDTIRLKDVFNTNPLAGRALANGSDPAWSVLEYTSDGLVESEENAAGYTTYFAYNAGEKLTSLRVTDGTGTNALEARDGVASGADPDVVSYTYDSLGRIKTETNALGHVTTYSYDDAGNVDFALDRFGHKTKYEYDALGNLLSVEFLEDTGSQVYVNPLGTDVKQVVNTYDNMGRLTTTTDAIGRTTTYIYNTASQIDYELDYRDHKTDYTYDNAGQLLSVEFLEDTGSGFVNPLGTGVMLATYTYHLDGKLASETDANGATTSYTYDDAGRLSSMIDPAGHKTLYGYNTAGDLLTVEFLEDTGSGFVNPLGTGVKLATYTYTALGELSTYEDALGNIVSYTYDALGREATAGTMTRSRSTEYDPLGLVTSTTDAFGRTTDYQYDAIGRLTSLTDELSYETTAAYADVGGQLVVTVTPPDPSPTDSIDPEWVTTYDIFGRVESETDPLDNTTTYTYDDIGRLETVTDPLSNVTTTSYQVVSGQLERTISRPNPDANGTGTADYVTTYDTLGRVESETDPLNNTTSYTYDNVGRILSETNPETGVTSYTYTTRGQLDTLTDPESNVTDWDYDALGRLIKETNELGDFREYDYDAAGHRTQKTDALGRITEWDYEFSFDGGSNYRIDQEQWLDTDGTTVLDTIDYTYNTTATYGPIGTLRSIEDGDSKYVYEYDDLGRITETDNLGGQTGGTSDSPAVIMGYHYDDGYERTRAVATVGGSWDHTTKTSYDSAGQVVTVRQTKPSGTAKRVDFAYNDAGQVTQITRYADLAKTEYVGTTNYAYNDAGLVTDLTHSLPQGGGSPVTLDYDYAYDASGRITEMVSPDGTTDYSYDDTNQLTAADHTFQTDETYTYDDNGNRTLTGYVTGDNNQLLSDGTYDYEYDDEGNRTKKTNKSTNDYVTYEWDHRNQLVAVSFFTSTDTLTKKVEYDYDGLGRRIGKAVDDNGDGTIDRGERYVYDDSGKTDPATGVPLDDIVLVFDDTGALTNRYLHGPGIDQVFADETSLGEIMWSLTDHQGTVRDVAEYDPATNTTTVSNHLTYDSFGQITAETNPNLTPKHAYTGRIWDEDVDLQYNRRRWYDPTVGRWISEDPIGFNAGDANLSRYVGNSAADTTDPSGLSWRMFGQRFYWPWEEGAGGFGPTLGTWGDAAGVAISGTASGAAAGATTGAVTGAAVGGIPSAGVGAGPGALAGAGVGGVAGGVTGFINSAFSNNCGDAAINGAIGGAVSGVAPGVGAGLGLTAGGTIATGSAGGALVGGGTVGGTVTVVSPVVVQGGLVTTGVVVGLHGPQQYYSEFQPIEREIIDAQTEANEQFAAARSFEGFAEQERANGNWLRAQKWDDVAELARARGERLREIARFLINCVRGR